MARKTVAERREELNRQMAELDVAEIIEEKLAKLTEEVDAWLQIAKKRPVIIGREPEQATSYRTGELIWSYGDDGGRYKDSDGEERFGATDWNEHKKPYHSPIWGDEPIPENELDEDTSNQIKAYTAILEHLNKMAY